MKKIRIEKMECLGSLVVNSFGKLNYYAVDKNKIFYLISKDTFDELKNYGFDEICFAGDIEEIKPVKIYNENEFEIDGIFLNSEITESDWFNKIDLMLEAIMKLSCNFWNNKRKKDFEEFVLSSFEEGEVQKNGLLLKFLETDEDGRATGNDIKHNLLYKDQIKTIEVCVDRMIGYKDKSFDKFKKSFEKWFEPYWKKRVADFGIVEVYDSIGN